MFVRDFMTANPVVVSPDTPIQEALKLMKDHGFGRLPVCSDGKLVGILTEADVMKVSPSPATTLSVYEINYLVSKVKVSEAMTKSPVTVSPDDTVEYAVLVMRDNKIGGVPVMDGDKLVGIITESNVFEALIEMLGFRRAGVRITIDVPDKVGVIAQIADLIKQHGVSIISLATYTKPESDLASLVVRVATDDASSIVSAVEEIGYKVVHVTASS
ncbi:MAG: CBS and ACT domain-containing protein [Bacillota bacterium]|jgi:acetoin utilization protein AcuB|nr:CBS domain-containing protein [Bacillota bacterium]HOB90920.1 CBS and ACT domain-containing protein [Bacillota bacterium]HPZ54905.1 CBS and ACT domain-containing protein [Bacillota bacterium]HQD18053.1 CBS and ACT domain-containing protein [Bacillota bacterium]